MPSLFGDVISLYTREQGIADGVLVDVSEVAREAGFKWPVALTQALWADIVGIPPEFAHEDTAGRLWDVLWMAYIAVQRSRGQRSHIEYELVLHTGDNGRAGRYRVKMVAGPGDDGEPVLTLMRPEED